MISEMVFVKNARFCSFSFQNFKILDLVHVTMHVMTLSASCARGFVKFQAALNITELTFL